MIAMKDQKQPNNIIGRYRREWRDPISSSILILSTQLYQLILKPKSISSSLLIITPVSPRYI